MNKSIAGYEIFTKPGEYQRMLQVMRYYLVPHSPLPFSKFITLKRVETLGFEQCVEDLCDPEDYLVQVIAYCLMPTHIHLVIKPGSDQGAVEYLGNVLNSYARYFNTKGERKGPLWVGRFKNVLVETDEQLLHLTRYVHLNPATAGLVARAEDWSYSSYAEYVTPKKIAYRWVDYTDLIDMTPQQYGRFVSDQADYQRELAIIKRQVLD